MFQRWNVLCWNRNGAEENLHQVEGELCFFSGQQLPEQRKWRWKEKVKLILYKWSHRDAVLRWNLTFEHHFYTIKPAVDCINTDADRLKTFVFTRTHSGLTNRSFSQRIRVWIEFKISKIFWKSLSTSWVHLKCSVVHTARSTKRNATVPVFICSVSKIS